jgi:hypothetical protein
LEIDGESRPTTACQSETVSSTGDRKFEEGKYGRSTRNIAEKSTSESQLLGVAAIAEQWVLPDL